MSDEATKQPPQMVHVSRIVDILSTGKITCRKCGAVYGLYVFNEYVMHDRLICRECGHDNSKPIEE